ncbi:MAG TPA: hypothetical protein PLD23_05320 [Armatimonadota bacterium]|nr:hypothetical protein [Armatimonadota bacterium]
MRAMLLAMAFGLGAGLAGCTVQVDLPSVNLGTGSSSLRTGFQRVIIDLSTNEQFMQYQSHFRGLTSASFSMVATNRAAVSQTVRVYGSMNMGLTADNVVSGATKLTEATIPAGAQNLSVSDQLDSEALAFLSSALQASPPVFAVYIVVEGDDPSALSFSSITLVPGAGQFSILSIRAVPGATPEIEIRIL